MDDPEVLMAALASSGIDAARIAAKSQEPAIKGRLVQLTEDAVARGAFGSPTFFVNDEMFFGKDQLRDVEEEILAQTSASGAREAKRAGAAG
jgi:2-hydroxychromene-2-carboxylate isomerase